MCASLNAEQQRAVEHTSGPLLVIAGAGSGKTRVVTQRTIHLLENGVQSGEILGLTFTNKASQEMNERIQKATSQYVLISTFHSLGAKILRESIHYMGYPNDFTIYDEDDAHKVLKTCLKELNLSDKKADIKEAKRTISTLKNDLVTEKELSYQSATVQDLFRLYQAKLKSYEAADFDDLLYLTVRLFQTCPEVLNYYQEKWKYLLIDEYQDTNEAQYTLIKLLVEKNRNLCVVGDPDQSIYSWRGANLHNILNFEKDYPEAIVVRLEQNYRSTSTILEAANALIRNNVERLEKKLWSGLGEGERIALITCDDEKHEAYAIARKIEKFKREGISYDDMVIFYRTNAQSRPFEDRFLYEQIPYQLIGGLSFYQRKEIKDILAYLRMAHSGSDFVSFQRTINLPKRGVGVATIEKLRQESDHAGLPILQSLEQVLDGTATIKLTPKQLSGVKDYVSLIRALKHETVLSSLVTKAIQQSGYLAVLKEDMQTYEDRLENVNALIAKAMEWEQEREEPTLEAFLEELSLRSSLDEAKVDLERVSLMTIHNGKGLEYPIVFMVGMEETLFPHINSQGELEKIEEERRLCYVGLTRAKKKLFLSHARARNLWGGWRPMHRSRFLREIPTEYLE